MGKVGLCFGCGGVGGEWGGRLWQGSGRAVWCVCVVSPDALCS